MKTLKLINGDLVFDQDGQLEMVSDDKELAQNLALILQTGLGEFDLDETIGLDRSNLLTKQFDEDSAQDDIVEALMQEGRVEEVRQINFTQNKQDRELSVDLEVTKTDGSPVIIEGVDVDAG